MFTGKHSQSLQKLREMLLCFFIVKIFPKQAEAEVVPSSS